MMYVDWIIAALGAIVAYMLLGYVWAWWSDRRAPGGSQQRRPPRPPQRNGRNGDEGT